jgi:DNA-binding CsgD family transcriptional regulator
MAPQMAVDFRRGLTPRERQIVALVAQGLRNREIATQLGISHNTLKNHLQNIFEKLGVHDRLVVCGKQINDYPARRGHA